MIRRFFAFTCFLGKFLILLKKKRKFLMYKNVRLFLHPFVEHIERKQRVFFRDISKFLWKVINSQHFSRLLIVWKQKVDVLQVAFKNYLAVREARILALSRAYNKTNHPGTSHRRVTLVPGLLSEVMQPSRRRNIIEYIKWYISRFLTTQNSFQLLSDHKSQKEFFQRPSITSTRKRHTAINK
jgi:hypothetical protein